MTDETEKKTNDCVMKCPECSQQINVCRSRIKPAKDPVCPGCGATLVPLTKPEKS